MKVEIKDLLEVLNGIKNMKVKDIKVLLIECEGALEIKTLKIKAFGTDTLSYSITCEKEKESINLEILDLAKFIKIIKNFGSSGEISLFANSIKQQEKEVFLKEEIIKGIEIKNIKQAEEEETLIEVWKLSELMDMYNLGKHAISKNTRDERLTGVNFNKTKISTCDGYRLSLLNSKSNRETEYSIEEEVFKFLSSLKDECEIAVNTAKNHIILSSEKFRIKTTRSIRELIDIEYLILVDHEIVCEISRTEWLKACKFLKNLGDKILIFENGSLETKDGKVKIEEKEGINKKYGIDANYLIDALMSFKDDIVKMKLNSNVHPLIFCTDDHLELVLPVRLAKAD